MKSHIFIQVMNYNQKHLSARSDFVELFIGCYLFNAVSLRQWIRFNSVKQDCFMTVLELLCFQTVKFIS